MNFKITFQRINKKQKQQQSSHKTFDLYIQDSQARHGVRKKYIYNQTGAVACTPASLIYGVA